MTESELRAAAAAHTRLLASMHADHLLSQTSYAAFAKLARRTHTEHVPQVADALRTLKGRDDDTGGRHA